MRVTFSFRFVSCSFSFFFFYQGVKWCPLESYCLFFFFLFDISNYLLSENIYFRNFAITRKDWKWTIRKWKEWDRSWWFIIDDIIIDDIGSRARSVHAVSAWATNNLGNYNDACLTTSKLFWLILDPRRDRKKTVDLDFSARHSCSFSLWRKFRRFRRTLRTWSYLSRTCTIFSNKNTREWFILTIITLQESALSL